jgi:hypothetical protein
MGWMKILEKYGLPLAAVPSQALTYLPAVLGVAAVSTPHVTGYQEQDSGLDKSIHTSIVRAKAGALIDCHRSN